MIKKECFDKDWIDKQKQQLGRVDPGILEKAIHALALLGHLAESNLSFVFKGGTRESYAANITAIRAAAEHARSERSAT